MIVQFTNVGSILSAPQSWTARMRSLTPRNIRAQIRGRGIFPRSHLQFDIEKESGVIIQQAGKVIIGTLRIEANGKQNSSKMRANAEQTASKTRAKAKQNGSKP